MKKTTKTKTVNNPLLQREREYFSIPPIVTLAHLSSEEKQKVMKLAENVML